MPTTAPAVELSQVGVRYRLYLERIYSLKERVVAKASSLAQGGSKLPKKEYDEFWAIRDISFNVPRGTCLGLTGRNGSGKSTILKVIAGVLHPSEGELWVRGRVSALIELGAGFNPELTGRENIYLGASMAGLTRAETHQRVDRIIEFSELHEFIDVPVRNYSSGMYARLGFALATDVDPNILIIDEILAVGDMDFQSKCLDRINRFKEQNKTILFVSHDPTAIERFCDAKIELEGGRIVKTL